MKMSKKKDPNSHSANLGPFYLHNYVIECIKFGKYKDFYNFR